MPFYRVLTRVGTPKQNSVANPGIVYYDTKTKAYVPVWVRSGKSAVLVKFEQVLKAAVCKCSSK